MSYEDALEIVEIERIWDAKKIPKLLRFVLFLEVILVHLGVLLFVICTLVLMIATIFLFGLIINAYISGGTYIFELLIFFPALAASLTCSSLIFWILWLLAQGKSEDLRYLVRFKILPPEGVEFSTSSFDPIEAVLQTLKGKERWYSKRKYKRRSVDSNQLDLIRIFLQKKYQRDVSEDECLRFFSMGKRSIESTTTSYIRYFFVMLDEESSELLFYSGHYNDWASLSEVLGEGGLFLFDISMTVVDMMKYMINDDWSTENVLISS